MKTVDRLTCDVCGACAGVCPVSAVSISFRLVRIDPETCTGCGACEIVCPLRAISEKPAGDSETSAAVIEAWTSPESIRRNRPEPP